MKLDKDTTARLSASIRRFFEEELDLEIGDLQAGEVLRFVLAEIGPTIHNRALAEAQAWLQNRAAEMADVHHQAESGWRKGR